MKGSLPQTMRSASRFGSICKKARFNSLQTVTRCFAGDAKDIEAGYASIKKDFPGLFPDSAGEAGELNKFFDVDLAKKDVTAAAKELAGKASAEELAAAGLPALDEAAITGAKGKVVGATNLDFDAMSDNIDIAGSYLNDILDLGADPDKGDMAEKDVNMLFKIATERKNFAESFINKGLAEGRDMDNTLPFGRREITELYRGKVPAAFDNHGEWTAEEKKEIAAVVKSSDEAFYNLVDAKLDEAGAGADAKVAEGLLKEVEGYFKGREAAQKVYTEGMNEVFDSQDISHYNWNKYAKSLFSCALWESKERTVEMEAELKRLKSFIDSSVDMTPEIVRRMYDANPNLPRSADLQPQTFDPFFTPKLIFALREAVDQEMIEAGIRTFYAGEFAKVSADGKAQLDEWRKANPEQTTVIPHRGQEGSTYYEQLAGQHRPIDEVIDATKAKYQAFNDGIGAGAATVESIAEGLLRKKLWIVEGDAREKAVKPLVGKLLDCARGKLDIAGLDAEIQKALPEGKQGVKPFSNEGVECNTEDRLLMCAFVDTRVQNPELLSFINLICEWPFASKRKPENILRKSHIAREILESEGFDPLIANTVVSMIEDRRPHLVYKMIADYLEISKKFRGEIHGTISSAQELSKAEYDSIVKTLKAKNPGKNFFLEQKVDKGLLGGFTVQAGVQRLDFSLATEIENFRRTQ